ncbi:MAG: RHS repeat-associated core domain-containing protein [Desulfococcaceae bacterium]
MLYQNYQPVPFVTSYFGKILSVSPQTSDGSTNIQIIGQAIDRATNSPLANVPLNIIVSLNGFDRTFKAFTDATGGFHSTFYPNANESGYYDVRALHPESTDNTSQGKFTISRVIVSPPGIDLNIPRNYEQKIDAINVTVGGLDIHNLQLVYEAADQTGGVLPPGVHISTGSVIPLLSSGQSANLECTVWADNLATDTGKIVLKVKSDEKTWGTVAVNTLFSEAKPVLTYTPDHIVTGLALDNIATETLVLENKGQAELSNAVLSIVKQDGTPAPHWVHLNADENFGTVAVGQKQDISISFAPNAVAKTDAPAVAEGIYYFYLKISSSNYPVVQIPLTVTVTQSGLGNIKFKVEDIYTKTIDKDTNQIIEGIRVEDNGKIRLQLIAADGTVLKEYEQALDSKGETRFENLPTGRYKYRASADNHQEMIGTVWSKPGVTSEEKIFLAFNLVTVEWEVTETTIQDKYDIVLTAVYETDVPAPVVVAEPASISLPDMKVGDVLSGEVKFVNYGLIRAENVKFGFPESDEYLKYEILANNLPGSIESKEFITIPYRITCLKSLTEDTAARSRRDSGGCYVNSAKICISFGAWCINEVWYDFGEVCFYMSAAYGQCSTGTAGGGIAIGYSGGDGGSIGIFNPPAMQMAGVLCPPERICSTDDPCCLMDKSEPVKSQIDLIRGEYRDDAVDLSVKVPGHVVEVKRYFYDNAWHFADLTEHLEIVYDSDGKTPKSIKKHGVFYKKADEEGLVYAFDENRHIFKETDGYRWKDSSGNWKRYDSTGKILSYGNRMNQKVSFIYDSGILTGLEDNSGKQVLWYEYLGNDVSAVKDANGRMVSYTYESGRLSKVTDILGYDWIYLYDAQGRLETKQDPEGNSTTITYNDFGYVSKVSGSDGQFKSFDYSQDSGKKEYSAQVTDSGGKIRQVWYNAKGDKLREDINGKTVQKIVYEGRKETLTDVNGNQTVREFDEWHNLLKETYADGSAVTYTYEPVFHNKTGITDERGVITKYEYDDAGNRKRKIEAYQTENERITEYTYYPDGSLWTEKTVADAATPESVTTMEYDDNGNMISLTDAEGNKTTFTHNIMGQVKTKTDPKGKVWTYDYDDMGNLKSLTDPLGSVTAYEYDKVGNKIKDTDPAGNITLYEYDSDRHLKKITDAYGNVTQFVYTNGRLTKRIDPEGKEVTQEYDAYGRLWKSIDGNGNVITYEYEGADGSTCPSCSGGAGSDVPAKVIYPTNFAKEFQYDSRGRKEIEKDVLSADESYSAQFKYDFSGNLISETDKENHTTVYGYDKLGRKFKVTDAISGITEYTYDDRNNLISLRDANGSFTQFEYDRNNRLKKEIRPLGQTTAYEYDSAGSLIWKTDAKAQKTGYDYDDAGRMKTIRYYAASENTPQKTVNFDYYPNGTLKSYADGKTSAAYTYDKLNRKISETVNYGDFQLVYGYAYYKNGLKKTFTMPDGTVYGYTYDSNNQLTGIEIPGKGTIAYSAYKWNRPESVTLPGGVSKTFSYDTLMRLQGIAVKNPAQAVLMQYGYAYDKMNNIKAKQTEHGNYGYVYDPIYRLTTADNAVLTDETYTYDAVGNRKTDAQAAGEWMYNSNNELGSYDGTVFAYDANGNMTQKSGNGEAFTYIYDVENRLVQVENKADGSVIAKYYYDPFGRRLWKEVNGVKTCFLYADEGLVGEYNAAGAVIKTYGFKPNSIWTTDPVFMKQGNEYYFYHNDHLGTPVQMTDGTGNAAWSAKYDAFGRVQVGAEMVVNNLRFPGQYFDGETGLYYNWYRYYDAGVGRYVATDPLKDGVNLYVYVFENPLKWIDPLGLKCTPEEILKAADEKAKNDKGGDYCTYLCKWDNNLGTYFKPKCNLVVYDVLKEAGCNIPKIHNNKYPPIANEWGDPEYKKIPDWYFTDRYNLKPGDIAVKTRNGHSGHLFIYAGKDKDGNNEFYTLNTDSGIFRKIKESEIPQETRPTAYRGYFNEQQWKNEMGIE